MATRLPKDILRAVRHAEDGGHRLVSHGAALFRCTQCNVREFVDPPSAFDPPRLFLKRCPALPKVPAPRNW